jgi:hypothetical protein
MDGFTRRHGEACFGPARRPPLSFGNSTFCFEWFCDVAREGSLEILYLEEEPVPRDLSENNDEILSRVRLRVCSLVCGLV